MRKNLRRSWTRIRQSVHNFVKSSPSAEPNLLVNNTKRNSLRARLSKKPILLETENKKASSLALFAREIFTNPRAIGAACPSSSYLGYAMAQPVMAQKDGLILELGAGTGSITAALLKHGIAPERLIVLERSKAMAEYLRKRFPQLRIIEGDAAQLKALLGSQSKKVNTVVSSLPLRSLPNSLVRTILRQIEDVLGESGLMVQFTYDLRGKSCKYQDKFFIRTASAIVWQNFPPARVDSFRPRMSQSINIEQMPNDAE